MRRATPVSRKPARAELAVEWLKQKSQVLWPPASLGDPFDWNLLFDPDETTGEDRIDYQVIKANVDPWACCAGSPAGSTRWRLPADGSGFAHLFLAGAWIDSGFNVECIEAAVMSGRQAARAIVGTTDSSRASPSCISSASLGGLSVQLRSEPKPRRRNAFWASRWPGGSLSRRLRVATAASEGVPDMAETGGKKRGSRSSAAASAR